MLVNDHIKALALGVMVAAVLTVAGTARANVPFKSAYILMPQGMKDIVLPKKIAGQLSQWDGFQAPRGRMIDLNHDRVPDFILTSSPNLCGTGGCPWIIVDGRRKKIIGNFFGSPLFILEKKIHGFPVIHTYSHSSAESGSYSSYVFDGREYQEVSRVLLEGESVRNLFEPIETRMREDNGS